MQSDGAGGQICGFIDVTVGQYGWADVLMVMATGLTVVKVLKLVVVYFVGVGVQVALEVFKIANAGESRASRLEGQNQSCWYDVEGVPGLQRWKIDHTSRPGKSWTDCTS